MIFRSFAIIVSSMLISAPSVAQNIAHLRTSCTGYSNCFTNMTDLSAWLWGTRFPTYEDPVTVMVGVGDFEGRLACAGTDGDSGFVTLKGESRTTSRLTGTVTTYPYAAVYSYQCDELDFENLTIVAPATSLGIGIYWAGVGDSRWVDVDVEAPYIAWYDSGCSGATTLPPTGIHFFQDSTLTAGGIGWFADCGKALIYDTTITVAPTNSTSVPSLGASTGGSGIVGVRGSYRADLYLLDATVTVDTTQKSAAVQTIGLDAGGGGNGHPTGSGKVEMFGGSLTVKGNADDTLYGARADKFSETSVPAEVRIQGTALTIQNGTAAATVVAGTGNVERVDLAP